ncbi:MAG: T9SS type A sorting domain-containing protein, partial [Fidelibacterota bacterium]
FALTFSAWVKTDLPTGMAAEANADPSAAIGFTVTWHDGTGGADGWGEVKGEDFRFTLAGDVTDWTQYTWTVTPPINATQYSLRARYWHNFVGTTYWDDFAMVKETRSTNLLADNVSGFEGDTPNYFKSGKDDGSTATLGWATDESRTGGHSIMIAKSAADGKAYWESDDLFRYWSAGASANVGMEVGAWVKLSGVNTSPAADSEEVHIIFTFLDANGNDMAGGPLVLEVPQTTASTGWTEVKSTAPISFPIKVDDIKFKFMMGKSATGTVWVDDLFIRPTTSGEWAGDFFGPNVDTPEGWFYWWPDFSAGKAVWDTLSAWTQPSYAGQDTSVARTGDASLKIVKDSTGYEIVVNSDFRPFVNDGRGLEFSAYVKTDLPTGMATLANSDPSAGIGFTVTWHDDTGGEDGWGELSGADAQFTLAGDVTDFTQYKAVLFPPDGATQFSLRARYWHNFVGTTYWDDFEVVKIDSVEEVVSGVNNLATVPRSFELDAVYPNPFNPTANIRFDIPYQGMVNVRVYDLLGRQVARLMDEQLEAGTYDVRWNAAANSGVPLASGIYLVRVQFDNRNVQIRKITYLK